MKNQPEKIYLIVGYEDNDNEDDFNELDQVTWAKERIYGADLEYTKAVEWIKIEREKDLPNDSFNYWVRQSDGIITSIRQYESNKKYWNITATHYMPIIRPEPPKED